MKNLTKEMIQQGGHTYTACKQLIEGVQICGDNTIRTCPCIYDKNTSERKEEKEVLSHASPVFTKTMDIGNEFNNEFFEKIYEEKLDFILAINRGDDHLCNECGYLKQETWGAFPKLRINRLYFSHSWACNCNCNYCNQDHAAPPNKRVVEFLIRARDLGYLFDNKILEAGFAGGEPTLLPDFEALVEYTKNARDIYSVLTSGIQFSDGIARILANPTPSRVSVGISIDAGTPDVYQSIKGVNQFERVVGNINKYYGVAANKESIHIKYIILKENYSKEQIDSFIKLIRTNGWQKATFIITNNKFIVSQEEYQATIEGFTYLKEQLTKLTNKAPHTMMWENK